MYEGRFEQELQELLDECNNLRRRWGESEDAFLMRQWRCQEEANHEAFRRRQQREREAQQAGAQNLLGVTTALNPRDANVQQQRIEQAEGEDFGISEAEATALNARGGDDFIDDNAMQRGGRNGTRQRQQEVEEFFNPEPEPPENASDDILPDVNAQDALQRAFGE